MVSIVYYTENVRFLKKYTLIWGKYLTRLKFCDKIINVNKCNYSYLYEVNMEEGKNNGKNRTL